MFTRLALLVLTATTVVLLSTARVGSVAHASPLSGGSTASASTVYQGVVSVAPGGAGADILELGNAGSDIASSGDIYLRPNSLGAAQGVRLTKSGTGKTDLHAIGGVCLNGGCRDTWPVVSGTSLWTLVSNQYLQPVTLSQGLNFATAGGFGYAMDVYGNNADAAVYIENTNAGGSALKIDNSLNINTGDLNVSTAINVQADVCLGGQHDNYVCSSSFDCFDGAAHTCGKRSYQVWHSGNDGVGSGLDASKLDGTELFFIYNQGATCSSNRYCLCAEVSTNTFPYYADRCIDLQ